MPDLNGRLAKFLKARGQSPETIELHPDASTRGYFRVQWNGSTAVGCVYPEEFDTAVGTYIDVTSLFVAGGLPVAEVIDYDVEQGVVVQEDLGDRILRDALLAADVERREILIDEAIRLIARIQAATPIAFERNSIASQLKFDTAKLSSELDFFKTHYFTTLQGRPLDPADDDALTQEFMELSAELETFARVLCHRDFHTANLMLDAQGRMRIIDHQDARIGSAAYDLVSLLLDRITEMPDEGWLAAKKRQFLKEREEYGCQPQISGSEFNYEFQLQTIQRCLKAAGTFSYQSAVRGKSHFVPFIKPMFQAALSAASDLERYSTLQSILERKLAIT